MSLEAITQAWRTPLPQPATKLVLVAIADVADESGEARPSIATLAEKCGLSRQSVMTQINKLELFGLLKANRKAGRQAVYFLQLVNVFDQFTKISTRRRRAILSILADGKPRTVRQIQAATGKRTGNMHSMLENLAFSLASTRGPLVLRHRRKGKAVLWWLERGGDL